MNHKFYILNEILNLKDLNQKRNYIDGIKRGGKATEEERSGVSLPCSIKTCLIISHKL